MVDTEPLKKYIASRDAFMAGDRESALSLLAESLGAAKPTPYMETYFDKLIGEPNDVILTLILHASKGDSE